LPRDYAPRKRSQGLAVEQNFTCGRRDAAVQRAQ
jgi:hypothetical protein